MYWPGFSIPGHGLVGPMNEFFDLDSSSTEEFEKLFRSYHKSLCRFAFNLVGDEQVAKDLVQEVFFKLWQNREKIEFGLQIKGYLFKATSRTALNHLQKSRRMITLLPELENLLSEHTEKRPDLTQAEIKAHLDAAIEQLPSRCRTIFLMSKMEGMKYTEIAEYLGLSMKTVENQMGIALKKLRKALGPIFDQL